MERCGEASATGAEKEWTHRGLCCRCCYALHSSPGRILATSGRIQGDAIAGSMHLDIVRVLRCVQSMQAIRPNLQSKKLLRTRQSRYSTRWLKTPITYPWDHSSTTCGKHKCVPLRLTVSVPLRGELTHTMPAIYISSCMDRIEYLHHMVPAPDIHLELVLWPGKRCSSK